MLGAARTADYAGWWLNSAPRGGSVTTANISGTNYRIHTFKSDGGFYVANLVPTTTQYYIVGGGGGGGYVGGGGGAGAVATGNITVAATTSYSVVVGAGGGGGTSNVVAVPNGFPGGNSVAFSVTALGGGGGGSGPNPVLLEDPEEDQLPLQDKQVVAPLEAMQAAAQLECFLEHNMVVVEVARAQQVLMVEHLPIQAQAAMAPPAISMVYLLCMLPVAVAELN